MRRRNSTDLLVSKRVKELRKLSKITQKTLGDILNITAQQVRKYENNTNRISSGTLYDLAQFFDVSVERFFDE